MAFVWKHRILITEGVWKTWSDSPHPVCEKILLKPLPCFQWHGWATLWATLWATQNEQHYAPASPLSRVQGSFLVWCRRSPPRPSSESAFVLMLGCPSEFISVKWEPLGYQMLIRGRRCPRKPGAGSASLHITCGWATSYFHFFSVKINQSF